MDENSMSDPPALSRVTRAFPPSQTMEEQNASQTGASSDDIVAQLSHAPATRTTVVTTTTTTTISFPPLAIKAPRRLRDRNLEEYPLAASPTPRALKKLKFDIGGRTAYFEEAENATQKLHQLANEQEELRAHGGVITHSRNKPRGSLRPSPLRFKSPNSGPSVPVRRDSSASEVDPDTTEMQSFLHRMEPLQTSRLMHAPTNPPGHQFDQGLVPTSPLEGSNPLESFTTRTPDPVPRPRSPSSVEPLSRTSSGTSSQTNPEGVSFAAPIPGVGPRLASTEVSLPSPSLSPITAAANLRRLPHPPHIGQAIHARSVPKTSPIQCTSPVEEDAPTKAPISVAAIPDMIETFDSMPDEMKTYVMYQFLRRCPKPTLYFVANAVDPAMRCDFLARLPTEISLNVLQHLDARSMARAAQVSRKWRVLVDTDERAWKALISADGFRLTSQEVRQAFAEGWGWQITGSGQELEEIAQAQALDPSNQATASRAATSSHAEPAIKSLKRKKNPKPAQIQVEKRRKRRATSGSFTESVHISEKRGGPNAVAVGAASYMPNGIGLPSLRQMHFFKSIYQHHAIRRQSWMQPDSRPKHFAFKAHNGRVVTCLQFDDEKIITGSDDANIDIFDTKTGRALTRLKGHDGGVWALEYHGDMLVSGSTDRTVRIWDIRKNRALHVFHGHTSTVRCLQILYPTKIGETADGEPIMMPRTPLIITGSRDSTCRIWKLPKPEDKPHRDDGSASHSSNPYFVRALQGHANSVRAIAAHGDTLVSGSYDTFVRAWKISTGECLFRLGGHTSKVYSIVLDHERNRCISGSMDYMVKVWSLDTGTCLFNLSGHSSLVGLLDLRDDLLVSAAADATLRVWDPANGQCKHELAGHSGAITCFLHDGQKIISGSDKTLKLWDVKTGECVRDLLTDLGSVWQIKFDERRCVAAVQRNEWTFIEVIDFGQRAEDGDLDSHGGVRHVVDGRGRLVRELPPAAIEGEAVAEDYDMID